MQIFVKTLAGKTITLDVELTDTIENVKAKIQGILGFDPLRQRLIYEGNEMEDKNYLLDYCVNARDTIRVGLKTGGPDMDFRKVLVFIGDEYEGEEYCRIYNLVPSVLVWDLKKTICADTGLNPTHYHVGTNNDEVSGPQDKEEEKNQSISRWCTWSQHYGNWVIRFFKNPWEGEESEYDYDNSEGEAEVRAAYSLISRLPQEEAQEFINYLNSH